MYNFIHIVKKRFWEGRNVFFSILLIVAFSSCEKALMPADVQPSAVATFDYLWQRFDQQYSQFDVKHVDWQMVYDTLRPKVYDGMSSDSLFSVCAAMLNTLQDGHVNLYANYDVSRADSLYYQFYSDYGVDMNVVVLNYLGINYHTAGGVAYGVLGDGKALYVRYASFSNSASLSLLHHIIGMYPEAEGMILDLRGNGGGNIANIPKILSVMPSHGQPIYASQIKSGPGREDFTPLVTTYAPTVPDSEAYHKPVYVLIDKGCFSATSLFAMATQAYDNMILLGDTTSGGTGLPTMGFLPNGWQYRLTITRSFANDGVNYENGIPPDIYVEFDRQAAQTQGTDNMIDTAISLIASRPINNNRRK